MRLSQVLRHCLPTMSVMRHITLPLLLLTATAAQAASQTYDPGFSLERGRIHLQLRNDGSYVEEIDYTWRVDGVQGIDAVGTERIGYVASLTDVESVEAWSTPPDGSVIHVPEDLIRTQVDQGEEGSAEFSDAHSKVILYPQVRVGSRVRYRARLNHHTPVFPGYFGFSYAHGGTLRLDDWEVTVDAPVGMKLAMDLRDVEGGFVETRDGRDLYRFNYSFTQPVQAEIGAVGDMNERPHVRLSTYKSLVEVGSAYQTASRPMAVVTPAIRERALSITKGLSTKEDKLRALHHWVARNIRYVFAGLGAGRWVPHPADEVLQKLYGDCKDHAILLESLLSAVGIQSSAALVEAGDRYAFPAVGYIGAIDHVITYVPALDRYVDSTSPFTPHGELGYAVMDKPTILTALGRLGRTPRMRADENRVSEQRVIQIQPDGQLVGKVRTSFKGVFGQRSRSNRFNAQGVDEAETVKDLLSRFNEPGIGQLEHEDPEALDKPFWVHADYVLEPLSNFPGPGALAVPVGISSGQLASIAADSPPPARRLPWRCGSATIEETTVLRFPESVEITFVPQGVSLQDGPYHYESHYVREGQQVTVTRRLVEQQQGSVCGQPEHEARLRFHAVLRRDLRAQLIYR